MGQKDNKKIKYIKPDHLSKAALGLLAGSAFLFTRFQEEGNAGIKPFQSCDNLLMQIEDCYSNCHIGMPTSSSKEGKLLLAEYYPFDRCEPIEGCGGPDEPPCPRKTTIEPRCKTCIDGKLMCDLWALYAALVAGRPDVHPYTYVRDRYGIPTTSTPYSLDNLRRIIDEALRIGPPYGYSEEHGPFLRYVRQTIIDGDPENMIKDDETVMCYWMGDCPP